MHFLGLAGMPRRIPDYPDAYSFLNQLSSIGSLMSFIGLFIFLYIIGDILTRNPSIRIITRFGFNSELINYNNFEYEARKYKILSIMKSRNIVA
jgi:heme/copper-type cytochrome/quinol oxidase subunit 1